MNEQELQAFMSQQIKDWQTSQHNQTNAYTFEKSFSDMMQTMGQRILQSSVGAVPKNRRLKKSSN